MISGTNLPFVTYDPVQKKIKVQSTLKTEVARYTLKIMATFDNIPGDSDRLLNDTLTVTVICECIDSLLDTLLLDYFKVTVEISKQSDPINLQIPKDSSSKVQGNKDGFSYCGDRLLFASIDEGPEFVVDQVSETLSSDTTSGNLIISPKSHSLIGSHTVHLWFALKNYNTVLTNKVYFDIFVVDKCI